MMVGTLRMWFSDSNTDVFQNLRLVYTSCKYFKFQEKNIPFSIFSEGHICKGFDRQTWRFAIYTLPPDQLFLNLAYK